MKLLHFTIILIIASSIILFSSQNVSGGKSRWEPAGTPTVSTFGTGPDQCDPDDPISRCAAGQSCINFQCIGCTNCPDDDSGPTQTLSGNGGGSTFAICSSSQCADADGSCIPSGGVSADGLFRCESGTWVDNCVNGAVAGICNTGQCGASSQCDTRNPSTLLTDGYCDSTCVYTDYDAGSSACGASGNTFLAGGETSAFGQYNTGTVTECCGDDAGENSRSRQTNCNKAGCASNDYPAIAADSGDAVCCNNANDCVFNGVCYTSNAAGAGPHNLGLSPLDTIVVCEPGSGIWYDCDNSQGVCTEPVSSGRCGLTWIAGGEATAFGEYNTGTATECCGDDSNEFYRSTLQGATTFSACCNAVTDCVDTDGSCVAVGSPSASNEYGCLASGWADKDTDPAACGIVGGQLAVIGEPAGSVSQFDRTAALLVEGQPVCCRTGDDCSFRWRQCAAGVCASDLTDNAICDKPSDCVFNGRCYSDIDNVINSLSLGFADRSAAWKDSIFHDEVSTDVNNNFISNFCDPGEWQGGAAGDLTGTVSNATEPAVPGVLVKVLGSTFEDTTAADGTYLISGIPEGTYDVTATQPQGLFQNALDVQITAFEVTTQDFVLVHPSGDCLDDCTKADGLCRAECEGKGLCHFDSAATRSACDFATPGLIDFGDQQINCCEGAAFTPVKADIQVCGDNVISLKRPVLFKGKLVNMVVTVFNAGPCE